MTQERQISNGFQTAIISALLLLLAASAAIQFTLANAGAKNWLLYAAGQMLSGRKLYVDIFEVNPPLILWIDVIPAWLSRHLPFLRDYNCLALVAYGVIAFCIALCDRLLRQHPAFAENPFKRRLFALLLACIFIFFTPPVYFFDREQIMMVMVLPYILRYMPALAKQHYPLRLRILIGAMAAIGFCMKPHAAIIFSVLQAIYLIRERSLRVLFSIENGIIYGGICLYLFCIWHFASDYITTVIPMAMKTYFVFGTPKADSLQFIIPVVVMLGIAFADFRRHVTPFRRDIFYFFGVILAFLLYALANNGWGYTFDPFINSGLLLCGWVWMEYHYLKTESARLGLPSKRFVFGMRACSIVFFLGSAYFIMCFSAYFLTFDCSKDARCLRKNSMLQQASKYAGHSFSSTPEDADEWLALSRMSGARWETRFNNLWMLPKMLMNQPEFRSSSQWIYNYMSRAYASDLSRWKPDTMFVDTSPNLFANFPNQDLIAVLNVTPEFKEAWKSYHLAGVVDVCHVPSAGEPATAAVVTDCRYTAYQRNQ